MEQFGVRFSINNPGRFDALRSLYTEIKRDKDAGRFRDPAEWPALVPDDIKDKFYWPTSEQLQHWVSIRNSVVTVVGDPSDQLSSKWNFNRVFETIEESEYDVLDCVCIAEDIGELHVTRTLTHMAELVH